MRLPTEARRLRLNYPIRPADTTDIEGLRREITRAQRSVARSGETLGTGGNNHKRIRIAVDLAYNSLTIDKLSGVLQGPAPRPPRHYIFAEEDVTVSPAAIFTTDAALVERGLAAHASTQNSLARALQNLGR